MLDRTKSKLDVHLARQFAWLLRKDLRETFQSVQDPAFVEWWLIKGRVDFPGWAEGDDPAHLAALFAPNGSATLGGVQIEVPKFSGLMAKYRPDAVRQFASEGKLDNEKFFAWTITRGIAEHKLCPYVPRSLVAMLDQPVRLAQQDPAEGDAQVPAVSLLMYLLWLLLDSKSQQARNIQHPDGRKVFLGWFFGVVGQLELSPLLAGRWKAWLKSVGPQVLQGNYPKPNELGWLTLSQTPAQAKPYPAVVPIANDKPFGLNIYGFAYGELGIGEDLRMAVECCEAANIPYHVVNVDAGDTRQADMHLKGKVSEGTEPPPYNTNLFCLPAFDTVSRVFMQKGAAVFEGYRNIGWWPWELSVFPKAWKPYAFELVDEVWASSKFMYDMYEQSTDKPVKLVPLAVSVDRMKPYPRKHYGLPDKKFLFLYIFDFNSSVARKNPMAAVQAFKQAFEPKDNSVGLVLKTMNTKPNNPEWQAFLKECQTDKRIQLITATLDRPEVLGLINACDAYVSLHRAEGFGRTLAEAMLLGKPVIATNYSGNVDFMHAMLAYPVPHTESLVDIKFYQWVELDDYSVWAESNIESAANSMLEVRIIRFDEITRKLFINEANELFGIDRVSSLLVNSL